MDNIKTIIRTTLTMIVALILIATITILIKNPKNWVTISISKTISFYRLWYITYNELTIMANNEEKIQKVILPYKKIIFRKESRERIFNGKRSELYKKINRLEKIIINENLIKTIFIYAII